MQPNHAAFAVFVLLAAANAQSYPIVDTGQRQCFDNQRAIAAPKPGAPFFGQDAQH